MHTSNYHTPTAPLPSLPKLRPTAGLLAGETTDFGVGRGERDVLSLHSLDVATVSSSCKIARRRVGTFLRNTNSGQ